jgi:hypothetical protein
LDANLRLGSFTGLPTLGTVLWEKDARQPSAFEEEKVGDKESEEAPLTKLGLYKALDIKNPSS